MDARRAHEVTVRLRAAGCVFAEDEAALLLEAATVAAGEEMERARLDEETLERMVAERVAGRPLEAILGWAEFAGLHVLVDDGVFVPRRRTEVLARAAVLGLREGAVVVDLCCGTGAVGAALADSARRAGLAVTLVASDLDPAAVANARRNLEPLGATVVAGDLFAALPEQLRGRIDVLAVNAPYVPTAGIATMPPEARDHEPLLALDGGFDGLDVHRRVTAGLAEWLAPGGLVAIETSESQAAGTAALLESVGLDVSVLHDDDLDGTAVLGRVRPAPASPLS
ncbi:putative protein N(5)-glutamine methyltransferase [Humibacter sp. BT305]|nr:putative protein N(5)-glutamine methyltransferase [Humibacter sp. BT305]